MAVYRVYCVYGLSGGADFIVPYDVNSDGNLDFVAMEDTCRPQYYKGNGDGTFEVEDLSSAIISESRPVIRSKPDMAVSDLDGDGDYDIVVFGTWFCYDSYCFYQEVIDLEDDDGYRGKYLPGFIEIYEGTKDGFKEGFLVVKGEETSNETGRAKQSWHIAAMIDIDFDGDVDILTEYDAWPYGGYLKSYKELHLYNNNGGDLSSAWGDYVKVEMYTGDMDMIENVYETEFEFDDNLVFLVYVESRYMYVVLDDYDREHGPPLFGDAIVGRTCWNGEVFFYGDFDNDGIDDILSSKWEFSLQLSSTPAPTMVPTMVSSTYSPSNMEEPRTMEPTHMEEPRTIEPSNMEESSTMESSNMEESSTMEPSNMVSSASGTRKKIPIKIIISIFFFLILIF